MVGRMDAVHTEAIFRYLMHLRVNQIEDAVECMMDIYQPSIYTNIPKMKDAFRAQLTRYVDSVQGDSNLNWGALLIEGLTVAMKHHCVIPAGLALFAKGWSAAEGTARWLCPEISYHSVVETADIQILRSWIGRRLNYRATASIFGDMIKLVTTLPRRINKILENLAWNTTRITVEAKLEPTVVQLVNKSVNRLAIAMMAASLFLGSAIMESFAPRVPGTTVAGSTGMVVSIVFMAYLVWRILRSKRA
jgi:ubiquinone biosynthesis protein